LKELEKSKPNLQGKRAEMRKKENLNRRGKTKTVSQC